MNHDAPHPSRVVTARGDWAFRGALVAACLALYLVGTAGSSVYDRDEARFALAVKEMSARGDWLVPSNFGAPRYNKPILSYWLALASTRALGMNEAALRLPSALCGIVTVLVTMAIAQRLRGRRVARIAGVVMATALYAVAEARLFTADASLLAATTISFGSWLRLRERSARPLLWQLLLWVSVGLGLLAKAVNVAFLGFAACAVSLAEGTWDARAKRVLALAVVVGACAVALPGLGAVGPSVLGAIAVVFLARSLQSDAGRHAWREVGAPWGIPLALTIVLAWGIPAVLATRGQFAAEGLGHHLLQRTVRPFEGHTGWPGYYVIATMVAFFPWGSILPAALVDAWRRRRDPATGFLLAWVLGPLVLVELTTSKLPHYMLVTFPALAILVAMLIDARMASTADWTRRTRGFEAGLFALVCASAATAVVFVSRTLDSNAVRLASVTLAAACLAVGVTSTVLWLRGLSRSLTMSLACGSAVLYLLVFAVLAPALEPLRLSPRLGEAVAQRLQPKDRLMLCRLRDASLGYYLPRAPDVTGDPVTVANALRRSAGDVLVLLPGQDSRCLAHLLAGDPARWDMLGGVRGLSLPGLAEQEVRIVRRHAVTAEGGR